MYSCNLEDIWVKIRPEKLSVRCWHLLIFIGATVLTSISSLQTTPDWVGHFTTGILTFWEVL